MISRDFSFRRTHFPSHKRSRTVLLEYRAFSFEMDMEEESQEAILVGEDLGTKKKEKTQPRLERVAELEAVLAEHSGKKQLIVLKGSPDPDSIGSAMAHKYLSSAFDIQSTIVHSEVISHQENRTLVKALEIPLVRYTEKSEIDFASFDFYSIVDSQSTDFIFKEKLRSDCFLLAFVDHHKNTYKEKALFLDVRENAGSTSSIYGDYIKHGSFPLSPSDPYATRLATALMHGIRTDTDNFFAAKDIDYRAATYLVQFADSELLKIFAMQKISSRTMQILNEALESKIIKDNFLVAGVGFVREEDRDGIAQAADYLMRREGIDTAIVFGIVHHHIDASLRTSSQSLDLDSFIKSLVGMDSENRSYGGGRVDKGGFQIPLGIFSNCSDRTLLWNITEKTICDMIFNKIGVSSASELPK
jgi:nanoRNase/pAp phosphatase (c-di-AMP/oligoRNAs hydrolase)